MTPLWQWPDEMDCADELTSIEEANSTLHHQPLRDDAPVIPFDPTCAVNTATALDELLEWCISPRYNVNAVSRMAVLTAKTLDGAPEHLLGADTTESEDLLSVAEEDTGKGGNKAEEGRTKGCCIQ